MRPTLTVTIPNYNHAHYLPGLLDALLSQSFQPDEIIIVDDGSTDNSIEVIESYQKRASLIRLIRHEQNRGCIHACHTALASVQTDYTYSIGADDLPLPGFHEHSMKLLAEYPDAGVSFTLPTTMNERGEINVAGNPWSKSPCYYRADELPGILEGTHIYGAGAIVKRKALIEAGGDIVEHRWHADWFYLLTIGFRHGGCFLPQSGVAIRIRSDSFNAAGRKERSQQVQVLQALMRTLISPPYRDVVGSFIRSRSFSIFGDECIDALTQAPDLWHPAAMMLVQHAFFGWLTRTSPDINTVLSHTFQRQQQELDSFKVRLARLELANGKSALASGRAGEAIESLMELVRIHPDYADAYPVLCSALRAAGYDQAADELRQTVQTLFPHLSANL